MCDSNVTNPSAFQCYACGGAMQAVCPRGAPCQAGLFDSYGFCSSVPRYYSGAWSQTSDSSPALITDSTSHLCWLTKVTGHFVGGAEYIHVYESGSSWYIGGGSEEQGIAGGATCVDYDAFTPESTGVNNWTNSFGVTSTSQPGAVSGGPSGVVVATTNTWQGDAATMIDGMTGEFDDSGWILVTQAGSASAFDTFVAQIWGDGGGVNPLGGWAGTFFVGVALASGFQPVVLRPLRRPRVGAAVRGDYTCGKRGVLSAVCKDHGERKPSHLLLLVDRRGVRRRG